MTEHEYIRRVHRHLPEGVYHWKIHDPYAGGVPDAWYSGDGGQVFVEYKFVKCLPVRPSTIMRPDLSSLQLKWLKDRYKQGVRVAAIVGSPEGGLIITDLTEMEQGVTQDTFRKRALGYKEVAAKIAAHCTGTKDIAHHEEYQPTGRSERCAPARHLASKTGRTGADSKQSGQRTGDIAKRVQPVHQLHGGPEHRHDLRDGRAAQSRPAGDRPGDLDQATAGRIESHSKASAAAGCGRFEKQEEGEICAS